MNHLLLKLLLCFLLSSPVFGQNIGINSTGSLPDSKAMLDISSTTSGLLIPRMSSAERNAIASPPNGLQVYNTTTNTLDIYKAGTWMPAANADTSVKIIRSLADLPVPVGNQITLDSTKTYSFSGLVNISPNYINTGGAALIGTDPIKDGVLSNVNGAILRSVNLHVFIEKMLIVPYSSTTKAFDFSDATGLRSCNLFPGINIKDGNGSSAGVGQVSGFRAVIILQNYWNTAHGIKVTGQMGRFVCAYTLLSGMSSGIGIEFLPGLVAEDIDLSNNHFVYPGGTGVKLNAGATVDMGRMTTNMFRGVGTLLSGFDSYTPGWGMQQNTGIPNTRSFAFSYMNDNLTPTSLPLTSVYYKIAGSTTVISEKRFTASDNRFIYIGKTPIVSRIFVAVGGRAPANTADFSIALAKNGVVIPFPNATMGAMTNNQGYQISLETEVDLVTGDYMEVFIKRNNAVITSVTVSDMQFRVRE